MRVVAFVALVGCGAAPSPEAVTKPPEPARPVASECSEATPKICTEKALALGKDGDAGRIRDLLERGCAGSDGRACGILARKHASGEGAEKDPGRAAKLADKACEHGDLPSCTALAHAMMDQRGVDEDMPRAVTLFRKACDGGEPEACTAMGRITGDGGIEALHDPVRAVKYFEVACAGKVPDACAELAVVKATGRGTETDVAGAKPLAERACDTGSSVGCTAQGALLVKDAGDAADKGAAVEAFERACTLQGSQASAWSCARVAYLHEIGFGVARDPKKAATLYERACEAGLGGKNPPGGDRLAGCVATGLGFEAGHGLLAEKDHGLAMALYTYACGKKSALGCAARGAHLERIGKKAQAMADYQRACTLGSQEACARLRKR
jgi:uncharacterized protein